MHRPNRRQLLKTTGAGAGIALGVGGASAQSATGQPAETASAGPDQREEVRVFEAVAKDGFIVIDGDGPEDGPISLSGSSIDGDIEIDGLIYDDNTWESTRVSFPPLSPEVFLEDFDLPISADQISGDIEVQVAPITGTFDAEAGLVTGEIDLTIDVDLTALGTVNVDFSVNVTAGLTTGESGSMTGSASGLDTNSATATLVGNEFALDATGVVIDPPLVDAIDIDEELGLPSPAGRNYLQIELELDIQDLDDQPDGPVELTSFTTTDSSGFLAFGTDDPTNPDTRVDFAQDITLEGKIYSDGTWESTNVNIPPIDLESLIKAQTGFLGDLDFAYTLDVGMVVDEPITGTYDPQTGVLTGDLAVTIEGTLDVVILGTLIDTAVDVVATLTTETSGEMEGSAEGLETGSPSVTVVSNDYPIDETSSDTVNTALGLASVSGENWAEIQMDLDIEDPAAFDGKLVFDPVVGDTPPQDLDGDGLFEDVQGSGEFVKQDANALFDNLDTDAVQSQSELFTFAGGLERQGVALVDVQALYNAYESGAPPNPPELIAPETDIDLSLEASDDTIGTGDVTTVDLVASGATEGIEAFDLTVSVDDSEAAAIVDFDHGKTVAADDSRITTDNSTLELRGAMFGNAYEGDEVTLATLEVEGLDPGTTTSLGLEVGQFPAGVFGADTTKYQVATRSGETISVEFAADVTVQNHASPGGQTVTVGEANAGDLGGYVGVWGKDGDSLTGPLGMQSIPGSTVEEMQIELDQPLSGDATVVVAVHPINDGGGVTPDTETILASDEADIDVGPPEIVAGNPPRDPDGDGLYEDVRGDGTVDIFDVQALFQNLDNPDIQNNSELFNFQGSNPDEVTIFDVQELFNKVN